MKKRLVIALIMLVLLSTYTPQKLTLSSIFTIKEIKINNNFILKEEEIINNLTFLYGSNIFFLNSALIENKLKNLYFVKSIEIKKIYTNKLKIKIFEKKPIAILYKKKKKFYLSESFDLIDYTYLENSEYLPVIYGTKDKFKILYKNLKETNFPLELIKKYFLYESDRWDIETNTKRVIKLPSKNYKKSLKNFLDIRGKNNFNEYKVFDYRINNQLILR